MVPHLPESAQKDKIARIVAEGPWLIRYKKANVEISMPENNVMKIFLRILLLDYNLELNLNTEIRTDSKNAFTQITQAMGGNWEKKTA